MYQYKYVLMILTLLLFASSLLSCSNGQHAGTTSETENEISFYVFMPDGQSAVNARIMLVNQAELEKNAGLGVRTYSDSLVTDASGYALLTGDQNFENYICLVQTDGYAFYTSLSGGDSVHIELQQAGAIAGQAQPNSVVTLDPIGVQVITAENGAFRMEDIPAGRFALLGQGGAASGETEILSTVQVESAQTAQVDVSAGLLLDDFDDGDENPALVSSGLGNAWYVYTEMAATSVEPVGIFDDFTLGIETLDSWRGNSLSISFILDENSSINAFGSIACEIGTDFGNGRANLSSLDSVSFMVKGQGRLRLFFASDYIHTQYPESEASSDLGYIFMAPAEWQRIVIPVDSLLPPAESGPAQDGVVWGDVSDRIDLFGMGSWDSPGSTVELQLDDIRLHGVSLQDLRE